VIGIEGSSKKWAYVGGVLVRYDPDSKTYTTLSHTQELLTVPQVAIATTVHRHYVGYLTSVEHHGVYTSGHDEPVTRGWFKYERLSRINFND